MASGSTVAATGMVTMTQVVAGDLIDDMDYNNARANIDRFLGNANDITLGILNTGVTYGYSVGGSGLFDATEGIDLVTATGLPGSFKDLQDDVQALCAFLGQPLRPGVGTDVNQGELITASDWSNLMLNIQDCWNSRFTPASSTTVTDASVNRTTTWTNTLTQTTTWTFTNEAACRGFFNAGGRIGTSASRSGGLATDQNTAWTNKLAGLGDVWLAYNTTVIPTSVGSNSGIGFYKLTTSDQRLVIYYGGFGANYYYAADYVEVLARVNSTTNPTQVIITTRLVDAGDSQIDASVDGTLTINARRSQPDANGSGIVVAQPIDSMSAISGS